MQSKRNRRSQQIPAWLIGLTVVAAVLAVLPIGAAVLQGPGAGAPRTAFAQAAGGAYVIGLRAGENEDVLLAAAATDPGQPIELTRLPHIAGQVTSGAVSPDGRRAAVVVAEAGTVAAPGYALLVVELESGATTRLANAVDGLQTPAWARDSQTLVFTRSVPVAESRVDVRFLRIAAAGGDEREVAAARRVLGAYSVAFDAGGRLLSVTIDERGSTLVRDGQELKLLSAQITRDWRLSPDGKALAFIESDTTAGLRYRPRVEPLDPSAAPALAQTAAGADGQALGVAWSPAGKVAFGSEPAVGAVVQAQAAGPAGFDIPVGFAPDGSAQVVQAWSGASFAEPGTMKMTVIDANGGRREAPGMTRVLGWSMR